MYRQSDINNNKVNSMNFSKLHLSEGVSTDAAALAAERATAGGEKQKQGTASSREKQKAQMAAQKNTPVKSDISYASEEARVEREYDKMLSNQTVDWRKELMESIAPDEQGNHPFVDVMPSMDQKQQEVKKQVKGAVKAQATGNVMGQSGMSEDVKSDLKASREYFKARAARSPEEKAAEEKKDAQGRAKNYAANRNNNIGQMDHSKKND